MPAQLALNDPEIGDGLGAEAALVAQLDRRAHLAQDRQQTDARRIDADVLDQQAVARREAARDDEERRRAEIRRARASRRRAAWPARPAVTVCPAPSADGSSRTPMLSSIRSVWSRLGPGERTVVVPPAPSRREQQRRLHLRARHRQLVVDAVQPRAAADQRRAAARRSPSRYAAPIEPQRRGDALHRALPQRGVARELAVERLPREQPHQQPNRGSGIAEVEHLARRSAAREARRRRCGRARRVAGRSRRPWPRAPLASRGSPRSRESRGRSSFPRAIAPSISARCEIDLSPGTVISPADAVRRQRAKAIGMLRHALV